MSTIRKIDCDEYLARGLAAVAASWRQHWVFGHNGAAIVCGAWLLRDDALPERLTSEQRASVEKGVATAWSSLA